MRISYYLPKHEVTNDELAAEFASSAWTSEKIFRKTGIRTRRVAREELTSDLAVAAAERLFDEHGVDRGEVDFILLCTQAPDYILPSTACIVQDRLGIPQSAGAFDYDLGCSGFVYGLMTAKGLIASGEAENVLLITSDTCSKYAHPKDRAMRIVAGDAAAATFIARDDVAGIGRFDFGTDGSGAQNLIVPAGGMAMPKSAKTSELIDGQGGCRTLENIFMDGSEIMSFTLRAVPGLVDRTLSKNGLTIDDIDYIVFHQANKLILAALADKLDFPEDKFCIDLEETGNTSSCSIPIALARAAEKRPDRIRPGARVLIAGFGVGYSWAGTVLTI